MELAPRITITIGACAVLLFGGGSLLQLRNEETELRGVAEGGLQLLGRSLQVAFENALRDRQIEDVSETLAALARVDPAVGIFVYDEEGKLVGASAGARPSVDTVRIQRLARERLAPVVEFSPEPDPQLLRLGLRLRDEIPASPSAIVLQKPLVEMRRDLANTRRNTWLATLAFVIVVAGLAWALTRRYVGLPLSRMIADMKRVREGNLQVGPAPRRFDEVGAAQHEFELLVRDLEAARGRAEEEIEARRRIERGLQNADKLITLGQLSAVMAHEIGSPLQVLEGRARALRKHAEDPEVTRRTAEMLVEQTERITRIVGQMLSITRRRAPVRAPVDGEACIRRVIALLELEARRRGVRLSAERAGECAVFADGDQLQQIALNLIRNALDASPRDAEVTVRLGGDERYFVLEILDEGPGIGETVRPHLFEPFFTTKADDGGSGLGLSVVKAIVQEHHGAVEFPAVVSGCLARVTLPRGQELSSP